MAYRIEQAPGAAPIEGHTKGCFGFVSFFEHPDESEGMVSTLERCLRTGALWKLGAVRVQWVELPPEDWDFFSFGLVHGPGDLVVGDVLIRASLDEARPYKPAPRAGPHRVYELASELELFSDEIMSLAQELNNKVRSHMSVLSHEECELIRASVRENSV